MTTEQIMPLILQLIVAAAVFLVAMYSARYLEKRVEALNALRDEMWPDDEIDTTTGCTVYDYRGIYLDEDVTPYEAATMIVATLGSAYTDKLIDALIDTFEVNPSEEQS